MGLIVMVPSKNGVKELMLVNETVRDIIAIEKYIELTSSKVKKSC